MARTTTIYNHTDPVWGGEGKEGEARTLKTAVFFLRSVLVCYLCGAGKEAATQHMHGCLYEQETCLGHPRMAQTPHLSLT